MRAFADRDPRSGVRLVTDPPAPRHTPPPPPPVEIEHLDFEPERPEGLVAWAGRINNGFAVQGLVDGEGTVYITCAIPGQNLYQTFEVAPEDAADAFEHPFAYGCNLPL